MPSPWRCVLGFELRRARQEANLPSCGDFPARCLHRFGTLAFTAGAAISVFAILGEGVRAHLTTAWYTEAQALHARGDLAATESLYRKTRRWMPGSAQATFNLAFVLDAQGRLDDAAGYYAQALQRDPGLDMSRVNLAIIHLQQSHPELAVPLLEESTAQTPYDVSTQFLLGGALRKVGREEEARARFLEALRIAPDFRPAQKALDLK